MKSERITRRSKGVLIASAVILTLFALISEAFTDGNSPFSAASGYTVQISQGTNQPAAQVPVFPGSDPFDNRILIDHDVTYGVGFCLDAFGQPYKKELKLDVYRPLNNVSNKKTAVLLIHGGVFGVQGVDKQYYPLVRAAGTFAKRGMVCFSMGFRTGDLLPDCFGMNKWVRAQRASYVDAKAAVRWIRAHAQTYGIDPYRIAAFGGSSGAASAMILAVTDPDDFATDYPGGQIPPENHPNEDPSVQACIEFWGTCLEKYWGNPPELHLFGFEDEFDSTDSPIMITHGTDDQSTLR